jgi:hypothetical protein
LDAENFKYPVNKRTENPAKKAQKEPSPKDLPTLLEWYR